MIKAGEHDADLAFSYIMHRKQSELYSYVSKFTADVNGKGDDVMQETCIALLNAVRDNKLKDPSKLMAFFSSTYRNRTIDMFRRLKKVQVQDEIEQIHQQDSQSSFDFILNELIRLRNNWLLKALSAAGSHCQEILLGKSNGKSSKKLGQELQMEPSSVDSRATQCRVSMMQACIELLGEKDQALLHIFSPRQREKWYDPVFRQKHENKVEALGYENWEAAREQAIRALGELYNFLFPTNDA